MSSGALNVDLILGPVEIGIMISIFLYGIATLQAYVYFRSCGARDTFWIRAMVLTLWLLETLITFLACVYLYNLTVTGFGKFDQIFNLSLSFDLMILLDGIIAGIVQSFFAWRVHVLSGSWVIPILSWSGSLARCIVDTVIFGLTSQQMSILRYEALYPWTITLTLCLSMVTDILNTCSICYFLHKIRNQFKQTDAIVDRIMAWSIETGLITSLCAILMLILFYAKGATTLWLGFLMFYVKLYSNSCFMSLNARSFLGGNGAGKNSQAEVAVNVVRSLVDPPPPSNSYYGRETPDGTSRSHPKFTYHQCGLSSNCHYDDHPSIEMSRV